MYLIELSKDVNIQSVRISAFFRKVCGGVYL